MEGLEFGGFDSGDHLLALVAHVQDGKGFSHDQFFVFDGGVAVEGEKLRDAFFWEIHPTLLDVADGRAGDADLDARSPHGDAAGSSHPAEDDRFTGDPLDVTARRGIQIFSFHDVAFRVSRVFDHEDERSFTVDDARSVVAD
jgi:hypothetical protein